MNMMFNARIFEDLSQNLLVLGEQFGSQVPRKVQDPLVQRMIDEARLHTFITCHTDLSNLLQSIYEKSDISKKEGSDPKNAVGEVLTWFYREGILTRKQLSDFVEQFESAALLSYDMSWLDTPEEQKLFRERCAKIARYHYMMNTFVGLLTQRVSFTTRRPNSGKA